MSNVLGDLDIKGLAKNYLQLKLSIKNLKGDPCTARALLNCRRSVSKVFTCVWFARAILIIMPVKQGWPAGWPAKVGQCAAEFLKIRRLAS